MHYFSDLFDKVLYMFRTGPLSIIRSISTLYTRSRYLSCQLGGLSASVVRMTTLGDRQQHQHDKYLLRVYSVQILLMMDSGPVRNMQSTLSNKSEKYCISLAFSIRIPGSSSYVYMKLANICLFQLDMFRAYTPIFRSNRIYNFLYKCCTKDTIRCICKGNYKFYCS